MRIVYLLLHDFRFASMGLDEFAHRRFHFSKEYARRMAALGHDVKLYVLSNEVSQREVLQMDGYEIKAFRVAAQFPPFIRFGNSHSLAALREIRRDSPDLVHIHNYYLWNFPYVAPWAKGRGNPVVAQFHGTDPIRRLKAMAFSPSLRLCDRLLVPTAEEQGLMTRGLLIPAWRVRKFPGSGTNTAVFRRTEAPATERTLLYVGRVPSQANYRWEKAPHSLLPILSALRTRGTKARLLVAGDGPGLESLRSTSKKLGLEGAVDFLGHLDQSKLPTLYSKSRLTLVPMQMDDIEPFRDGSVQESLACGTPVVAFNNRKPGFRKLGLLVPTEPKQAAGLISAALERDELLAEARELGPLFVSQNCDWDVMMRRLDDLYGELVN